MTTDIKFACSSCGQRMLVEAEAAGLAIDCPYCATQVTIPKLGALHDREYPAPTAPQREGLRTTSAPRGDAPAKDEYLDPELATLRQELLEASIQATRLEGELTDARAAAEKLRGELKTAAKEKRDLVKKLTAHEAQLAEGQAALAALRTENHTLTARLAALELEREKLATDLRARELELTAERDSHATTQSDRLATARQLEALKTRASQLETDLASARADLAAAQKKQAKLAAAEGELAAARRQLTQRGEELATRQRDLAKAREEIAALQRSLTENSAGQELLATRDELATTRQQRDSLTAQARQLTADLAAVEAARRERDEQLKALRAELDEARRRAEATGEVRLRQDNEVLRGIIARQNTELEQRHVQIVRLKRARFGVRLAYAAFAIALLGLAVWAVKVVPHFGALLKF
jgi:chromosome segregation ATPase/DNA-directed RNA polymerase subunit RPC12/RpoP